MKMVESTTKRVIHTVEKGEIAQESCTADKEKQGLVWESVYSLPDNKMLALSKLKAFADDNFS